MTPIGFPLFDRHRPRRSKLAWVLIIILFPFVGVLAYLFSHVGLSGPSPEQAMPDSNVTDVRSDEPKVPKLVKISDSIVFSAVRRRVRDD